MQQKKTEIQCNCCGKKWKEKNAIIKHDFLEVQKEWGYFSEKDGAKQKFCICEECYDKWVAQFVVSPVSFEVTEIM